MATTTATNPAKPSSNRSIASVPVKPRSSRSINLPDNVPVKVTLASKECCGRFRSELFHGCFTQEEVFGEMVHGPATFAPAGRWIFLLKTLLMLWVGSVLVDGVLATPEPRVFYLAYLTHWSLILTTAYLLTSWFSTLKSTLADAATSEIIGPIDTDVTWFHRLTWALFVVAAPAEVVVAVGYWGLEWNGSTDAFYYRNIMVHGVVILITLFDGLILNRIPLRVAHFGMVFVYFSLYFGWTVFHAYYDIGNPTADDDTLYTALQWKSDPLSTLIVAAQMMFITVPVAFLIVYGLALYSFPCGCNAESRRYLTLYNRSNSPTNGDSDESTANFTAMGCGV